MLTEFFQRSSRKAVEAVKERRQGKFHPVAEASAGCMQLYKSMVASMVAFNSGRGVHPDGARFVWDFFETNYDQTVKALNSIIRDQQEIITESSELVGRSAETTAATRLRRSPTHKWTSKVTDHNLSHHCW